MKGAFFGQKGKRKGKRDSDYESSEESDETSDVSDSEIEPVEVDTWIQCNSCEKWRKIRAERSVCCCLFRCFLFSCFYCLPFVSLVPGDSDSDDDLPTEWYCMMNPDPNFNSCDKPEEQGAGGPPPHKACHHSFSRHVGFLISELLSFFFSSRFSGTGFLFSFKDLLELLEDSWNLSFHPKTIRSVPQQ